MTGTIADRFNETPATYALLLIYVTMAFLTGSLGMESGGSLVDYGASVGILVQDGESWRLLSSAFLHGNLIHLLFNSYGLLVLGPGLERYFKTPRFVLLYLISALAGSVIANLMTFWFIPVVGGSGALFGMLGAALATNVRGGRTMLDFMEDRGTRRLMMIIAINLGLGFMIPIVSNSAHVGGLVAGFVLVFCFFDVGRRETVDGTGRVIQAGLIATLAALTLYSLFPVLRLDYNLKAYYLDHHRSASQRQMLGQVVWEMDRDIGLFGSEDLRLSDSARTNLPRTYIEVIERWEKGR